MDTPRLSVVIPTYRAPELALRAASALDPIPAWAEVIVVDDGSSDNTVESIRQAMPAVTAIGLDENRGFGGAVNAGFANARGACLATLNNDAVATWDAFETLLAGLDRAPRIGAVAPAILDESGTPARVAFRFPRPVWSKLGDALAGARRPSAGASAPAAGEGAFRCDYVKGACVVFRREALTESGLFDEQFWMFAEEIDLFRRLDDRGWESWVDPAATIRHVGGSTTRNHPDRSESSRFRQHSYRSMCLYYGKHHALPAALAMRLELALRVAGRAVGEVARLATGRGDRWWVAEHLRCLRTLAGRYPSRPRIARLPSGSGS